MILVGRARFELATNGLKEVVPLQNPLKINGLKGQKMTVRLSVRLNKAEDAQKIAFLV